MTTATDLVNPAELARRLGVTRGCVSNWETRHHDFPRAVVSSETGRRAYSLSEVKAWLEARKK